MTCPDTGYRSQRVYRAQTVARPHVLFRMYGRAWYALLGTATGATRPIPNLSQRWKDRCAVRRRDLKIAAGKGLVLVQRTAERIEAYSLTEEGDQPMLAFKSVCPLKTDDVKSVFFSSGAAHFVTCHTYDIIKVFSSESGTALSTIKGTAHALCLQWPLLATWNYGGCNVEVFDAASGHLLKSLERDWRCFQVGFNPDFLVLGIEPLTQDKNLVALFSIKALANSELSQEEIKEVAKVTAVDDTEEEGDHFEPMWGLR